jgi:hypothetical protein
MRFWSLNTCRSIVRHGKVFQSYIGACAVLMSSALLLGPYHPDHRADVGISLGFPQGIGFFGNPSRSAHTVDTCSTVDQRSRTPTGYFVPDARFAQP